MNILLNIALLIIGAASTMSAFGGKTWREGPEPILERITSRGWISLFCLILAVFLGVTKEIRSQIADTLAKNNSEREHAAAKAQARESELQMKLANAGAVGPVLLVPTWVTEARHPRSFVLTGFVHDLGRVLCLYCEPPWAAVADQRNRPYGRICWPSSFHARSSGGDALSGWLFDLRTTRSSLIVMIFCPA